MNHLLAKTKGRNGGFFKIISNEEIFELPDNLDNPIPYDSNYKLEDDEWFSIEDFSNKDYSIEFLTKRFISTDFNQIEVSDYPKIEFLCSYQTGVYYFQKLSPSQIIRKRYFSISNEITSIENEPIIVINNFPDAIYNKEDDILFFRNLTSITGIFKGIETLYREATQEETEAFLENSFISLVDNYSADKVKTANRKRIAMAMQTLQGFSDEARSSIFEYIREYCTDLDFDEDWQTFDISNEDGLKKLLYGIEQRYYTTRQGGEKRLANSIITLQ